jgi:hypothetical protein
MEQLVRIVKALLLTLIVGGLTVYGPLELSRFISDFYKLTRFPLFVGEFAVMWAGYFGGLLIVFLIALKAMRQDER